MSQAKHEDGAAGGLFEDLEPVDKHAVNAQAQQRSAELQHQPARLLQPNRQQLELGASNLESLLGEDHHAWLVRGYVERQDQSRLTDAIKARCTYMDQALATVCVELRGVNTVLANLKTMISGTYNSFNFRKYAQQYLGSFSYRFNGRFDLRALLHALQRYSAAGAAIHERQIRAMAETFVVSMGLLWI